MRKVVVLLAVGLLAVPALAQPFNARGSFNGWGETPMTDNLDGTYSVTIGGLTAGNWEDFKVAENDWASSWPTSDVRAVVGASQSLEIHFRPGPIADGWNPPGNRVGYTDTGAVVWELSGGFNGWAVGDPASTLADMGAGLHSVDYTIALPGTYEFKFKSTATWDVALGAHGEFGNFGDNASMTTTAPNEIVRFELDLPNGRWRTTVVPEPATLALLGLGGFALVRRSRR